MPISLPESKPQPVRSWLSPDRTRLISAREALEAAAKNSAQLLDVRAPIEFQKGSLPHAVNLPLLTDPEREAVGIAYKKMGKADAIQMGEDFLLTTKNARADAWCKWAREETTPILFCARGGMRSTIVQNWILERGQEILRVEHGYKALRQECLKFLDVPFSCFILGGLTGSAKTRFLRSLAQESPPIARAFIDLELAANHKGSAFGKPLSGQQPSAQDFENAIALELLKKRSPRMPLIFEDESKTIGRLRHPNHFYEQLSRGQHVILELSLEERVSFIYEDYVHSPSLLHGESPVRKSILDSLHGIRSKLGDERYKKCLLWICEGFDQQRIDRHRQWIECLLLEYYDPMYRYASAKKNRTVLFRGNPAATRDFLKLSFEKLA